MRYLRTNIINSKNRIMSGPKAARVFDYIGYVVTTIFVIGLACLFFSCGSTRQKDIVKSEVKTETASAVDSVGTEREKTNIVIKSDSIFNEETLEEVYEYDGLLGDTLSIEKYGADGKLLSRTKLTGKGKAKHATTIKKVQGNKTASTASDKETTAAVHVEKKSSEAKSQSNYDKHVKSSGLSFMTWFWIIIIIIVIIILLYLNYQFKWFSTAKNYVTALFS